MTKHQQQYRSEPKHHEDKAPSADAAPPVQTIKPVVEAPKVESVVQVAPAHHPYARDNALGGWTCPKCSKHVVVPGDLYIGTCPAP